MEAGIGVELIVDHEAGIERHDATFVDRAEVFANVQEVTVAEESISHGQERVGGTL